MISFNNVSISKGNKKLLDDANILISEGHRIGIIGRNGCGKTTLFQTISDETYLETGEITKSSNLRLSLMAQETPGVERAAIDFVIDAHVEFRALEKQKLIAEELCDNDALTTVVSKLDEIEGYKVTNSAQQVLNGLGFSIEDYEKPVTDFSGGWRVKLNLAAALLCPSDLLMLDEPTNHLDLEATIWLEQWLLKYKGTLLLVSHDRAFLDKVIDHVISFEGCHLRMYVGNYSAFERQHAERLALEASLSRKQEARKKKIEEFVRRFRAKASKANQAQSRLRELKRMQDISPAHVDSPFEFKFLEPKIKPNFLLEIDDLSIGFGSPLASHINLMVRCESRIGLLGFNGSGKSTLIKVLAGQLKALSGVVKKSKHIKIGYYAQHQVDALNLEASPLELISAVGESDGLPNPKTEQQIRDFLGGFDFHGSRADEAIKNFSGGEKARVALAKIVCAEPNLLLLDEPTNHLDLDMCHALELALQEYEGAMVVISHDRHLLANTVDEFYAINNGKFKEYSGSIYDYEAWLGEVGQSERGSVFKKSRNQFVQDDKKEVRKKAAAERQKLAPLKRQVKLLEAEIEKILTELKLTEEELSNENIYGSNQKSHLVDTLERQGRLKSLLMDKEGEWYEMQKKLDLC